MSFSVELKWAVADETLASEISKGKSAVLEQLGALQDKTCVDSELTGWYDFPKEKGFTLSDKITDFKQQLEIAYDLVVIIGIGGSYLGARAAIEALQHNYAQLLGHSQPAVVYLGHHLSEAAMIETLELIADRLPIVNVISKSGTTTEPSIAFRLVKKHLEDRFGKDEAAARIIATTDPDKGALRELALSSGYQMFEVPVDLGGRYSVLSAVGLLPIALAGYDIKALMQGGADIFSELRDRPERHPLVEYTAARVASYRAGKKIEILAYANPKAYYFSEWWKQLFAESEGKDQKGLFPTGLQLTTDLHSLGQYVQEGERHLVETFLAFRDESYERGGVERQLKVPVGMGDADKLAYLEGKRINAVNEAAMAATRLAHSAGSVPCWQLSFGKLDARGIGQMFAFFETAAAVSCLCLGVNPFDQPGVEAYKKNLFALMGRPGFEELQSQLQKQLDQNSN